MVTIKCTVYEKYNLLRKLDMLEDYIKADNHVTENYIKLEKQEIQMLRNRINGKYKEDYFEVGSREGREKSDRKPEREKAPKCDLLSDLYD